MNNYLKYKFRKLLRENHLATLRSKSLVARERGFSREIDQITNLLLYRSITRATVVIPAYKATAGKVPVSSIKQFVRDNFPILDKTSLLSRREEFYPRKGVALPWWSIGKTSGTSGTPLDIFRDFNSAIWEHAFHLQHWKWASLRRGDRQVVLRGDLVVPPDKKSPPFWHHDNFGRQLIVSTRHLGGAHIRVIADAIKAFGATQLRAYPSAAHELARLVEEHQLNLNFRSIITGSEILYPTHREFIERILGGRVYDFYGMAERVAFGSECEYGRMHIHPEYSFVEIVDSNGNPTDGEGFIVGTTFLNLTMPLVRYRLNDSARWNHSPCPCGRTYPTVDYIIGKVEDTLFDLDGKPVSPSIITFAFKGVGHIAKSQVAQLTPTEWVVRIVPGPSYSDADGRQLLANFKHLVSDRLNVSLCLKQSLDAMPSGKYKWVSQESKV